MPHSPLAWRTSCKKPGCCVDDDLEQWHARVFAHLLAWPLSRHVDVIYAESGDGVAQYRIRVSLVDGSLLQCVERVRANHGKLFTEKYSFHWQRDDGSLIFRWDNAPHHREISSFPDHLHASDETNVAPHAAVDVFAVMELIEVSGLGQAS